MTTDDDEDVGLSGFDAHESGTCSGLGSCSYCLAEDVLRRERLRRTSAPIKSGYSSVATESGE